MTNSLIVKAVATLMGVLIIATLVWPVRSDISARTDERIASDLDRISSAISNHFSANSSLPESLDELSLDSDMRSRSERHDYEYFHQDFGDYQLCAKFKTDTTFAEPQDTFGALDADPETTIHEAGRVCFDYEVPLFDSFDSNFNFEADDLPFDADSFDTNLNQLEGLDDLLTPENLELFESLEL